MSDPCVLTEEDWEPWRARLMRAMSDGLCSFLNIGQGGGSRSSVYEIEYALRVNSADSAYLTFTPGSAGNRRTFTAIATWFVRVKPDTDLYLLTTGTDGNNYETIHVRSDNKIEVQGLTAGSYIYNYRTPELRRDPAAPMHVVVAFDTTQATASNRVKIWVNGVQIAYSTLTNVTDVAQNTDSRFNNTVAHSIGRFQAAASGYSDTYLSQTAVLIDGAQLAGTDFVEFDDYGNPVPIDVTGLVRGTNGALLDYSNSAAFGQDQGAGTNDWTATNFTSADQVTDTPTNVFATLNPLWAGCTLSDGNTVATNTGANEYQWAISSIAIPTTGQWVFEAARTAGTFGYVGIAQMGNHAAKTGNDKMIGVNVGNGDIVKNASSLTSITTPGASVIRIEYDADLDDLEIFDDGVSVYTNSAVGLTGHNSLHFFVAPYNGASFTTRFGATSGFVGTPTTGFLSLCTANLPAPAIPDGSAHHQTTLYTGTGSSLEVNQSGNSTFTPGLVWNKSRTASHDHYLWDVLRGTTNWLRSNTNDAEAALAQGLTSFDSDGFTMGTNAAVNQSTITFAAWQWKANGAGVSNTSGSITSSVSADVVGGFSVVLYTGTGANATVGHGLGVAPKFIVFKRRNAVEDWYAYHGAFAATDRYQFNGTNARTSSAATFMNSAAPDSTVFSLGTSSAANAAGALMIAYCFAEVPGYSKIGRYTGNGSADGAFVYCGFRPAWVLIKRSDSTESWTIHDTARDTYNECDKDLLVETAQAEDVGMSAVFGDILSNGFKCRSTSTATNASGGTYIYMAFAERPFGGEGVSPAKAR
jgi:hypothetical protein